jgi:S1-C subfamily serine protease
MFKDLPENHMFYADIMRHVNLGLISGYEDGTVKPDEPLTLGRYCAIENRKSFRERVEKDVLESVLPAVLTMVTQLPDGKSGQGTGFFISPNLILTNEHVVKNGVKFLAYGKLGTLTLKLKALSDISFMQDLAVMESPIASPVWLKLREAPLYQGQHIGVIGTPIGLMNTFTQGVISHLNREGWTGNMDWFQTDAAINPGNSGGPIIDGRGHLCGVSVAKVQGVGIEGLAYGVKVDKVKAWLDKMGVRV